MVTDYWQKNDQWKYNGMTTGGFSVSRAEFEQLRKEMLELKELLKSAKVYDELTNQPNCEKEENVKVLRRIANALDVNLDDIFEEKSE
jgi:hypothetical protein